MIALKIWHSYFKGIKSFLNETSVKMSLKSKPYL